MNLSFVSSLEGYASEALGEMPEGCGPGYCVARDGRESLELVLGTEYNENVRNCCVIWVFHLQAGARVASTHSRKRILPMRVFWRTLKHNLRGQ